MVQTQQHYRLGVAAVVQDPGGRCHGQSAPSIINPPDDVSIYKLVSAHFYERLGWLDARAGAGVLSDGPREGRQGMDLPQGRVGDRRGRGLLQNRHLRQVTNLVTSSDDDSYSVHNHLAWVSLM